MSKLFKVKPCSCGRKGCSGWQAIAEVSMPENAEHIAQALRGGIEWKDGPTVEGRTIYGHVNITHERRLP